MTSLYYEQYVDSPKVPTKSLIQLSELQRAFNKKQTLESSKNYLNALQKLVCTVRYRRIPLKQHPTFTFGNIKSTNWTMELIRVSSTYKNMLKQAAKGQDDLKDKNRTLLQALQLSNDCSRYAESIAFDTESNRSYKQLNPQYHLSQTMGIAADRFFNINSFRDNALAIKRAFQLKELSFLLWKNDEDIEDVIKYKAKALLAMAMSLEDDECGQKIALLEGIVTKDPCPEEVKSEYEKWKQQNESVYYKPVTTDLKLDVIDLEEAFRILSKSFECPST